MASATAAPAPMTIRSRRLSAGILPPLCLAPNWDLPRGADAELLLVLRLRHGRGELHALEPARARGVHLARDEDAEQGAVPHPRRVGGPSWARGKGAVGCRRSACASGWSSAPEPPSRSPSAAISSSSSRS